MPELPEVEVIVRELKHKIIGEIINDVSVFWEKSWVGDASMKIFPSLIKNITRKGKYILIHLDNGFLIAHLRMTGQFIVNGDVTLNTRHLRIILHFKSGKNMLFYDARKFGRVIFTDSPDDILSKTGMDALNERFTSAYLKQICNNRHMGLKRFLLDQSHIAGLGNIYVDESLFQAGLHPERIVDSLQTSEIKKLYSAITVVLRNAIDGMGTTISDYKTTGGGFGQFQSKLQVYGRSALPCVVCHEPIQKIKINNRGTHFCPQCQKI
jgi:formamidopyrimidine-DNA glycosylase